MQRVATTVARRGGFALPPLAAVVLLLAAPAPPAYAQQSLDTTMQLLNTEAPPGGVFRATGESSCTGTYVTLKFYRHDGQFDAVTRPARIVRTKPNGMYEYRIDLRVPSEARPGDGAMFADTDCGNPDAAPSDQQRVRIVPARLTLRLSGTSTLTVTGSGCYGDADGRVTVRSSRGQAVVAALRGDRFAASFTGTPGPVTFSVGAPDCPGSHPASVSGRFAAAPSVSPSPQPSRKSPSTTPPTASTSPAVTPTVSVRPSPSRTSASPSSSPSALTVDLPRDPEATVPWLLYGFAAAAVLIGGTLAAVWWARR